MKEREQAPGEVLVEWLYDSFSLAADGVQGECSCVSEEKRQRCHGPSANDGVRDACVIQTFEHQHRELSESVQTDREIEESTVHLETDTQGIQAATAASTPTPLPPPPPVIPVEVVEMAAVSGGPVDTTRFTSDSPVPLPPPPPSFVPFYPSERLLDAPTMPPMCPYSSRPTSDACVRPSTYPVSRNSQPKPSARHSCPQGHALELMATPVDGYLCNACSKHCSRGTNMWSCRQCDHDTCDQCACTATDVADLVPSDFSHGERVKYWTNSQRMWLDGIIAEVYNTQCITDKYSVPAGAVRVMTSVGEKWVPPELVGTVLRRVC